MTVIYELSSFVKIYHVRSKSKIVVFSVMGNDIRGRKPTWEDPNLMNIVMFQFVPGLGSSTPPTAGVSDQL